MVQDNKKQQNITNYQLNGKKYTVITKTIENAQDKERIYQILSQYIISQERCRSCAKDI